MLKKLFLKQALSVLIILFVFSACPNLTGQKKASNTSSTYEGTKNAFFVEILGNGLFFSANYDVRVANKFGIRAGVGYMSITDDWDILTIPVMGNFLLGKNGSYFELGAGIVYASGNNSFFSDDDDSFSSVLGTLSFMYRNQPVDGGFMWKIGLTPFFGEGAFIPYWGGVGLGYCW